MGKQKTTGPAPDVRRVPLEWLHEDPANARLHGARNLDQIKASLTRFGQQELLVATEDGLVLAGNGRLRAMRELGWTHANVLVTTLAGFEAAAYSIASNRTAETAEWDRDVLSATLRKLQAEEPDLAFAAGFDDAEISALSSEWEVPAADDDAVGEYDPDKETVTIKIEGVRAADKDDLLDRIGEAIEGTGYAAKAF
jgi:ParB-like chromosome segregation protein Spo0J